jgi:hypothetical protein
MSTFKFVGTPSKTKVTTDLGVIKLNLCQRFDSKSTQIIRVSSHRFHWSFHWKVNSLTNLEILTFSKTPTLWGFPVLWISYRFRGVHSGGFDTLRVLRLSRFLILWGTSGSLRGPHSLRISNSVKILNYLKTSNCLKNPNSENFQFFESFKLFGDSKLLEGLKPLNND